MSLSCLVFLFIDLILFNIHTEPLFLWAPDEFYLLIVGIKSLTFSIFTDRLYFNILSYFSLVFFLFFLFLTVFFSKLWFLFPLYNLWALYFFFWLVFILFPNSHIQTHIFLLLIIYQVFKYFFSTRCSISPQFPKLMPTEHFYFITHILPCPTIC